MDADGEDGVPSTGSKAGPMTAAQRRGFFHGLSRSRRFEGPGEMES